MKRWGWLLFILVIPGQVQAATYYVATNGSDNNAGTAGAPFKTIGKGVATITAGDTLQVGGGVYKEKVTVSKSGSSGAMITLSGPGATIDGAGQALAPNSALVGLTGSYIKFQGFTVVNSNGRGIESRGNYNTAANNKVSNISDAGMHVSGGRNNTFADNEVFHTVTMNATAVSEGGISCSLNSSGGWPSALNRYNGAGNNVWTGNNVHDNCGEGIVAGDNDRIVNNTFSDNYSVDIYLDNAIGVTVEGNKITETETTNTNNRLLAQGIAVADESECLSTGNIIRNNQVKGTAAGFNFYEYNSCSGLKNTVINGNIFENTRTAGIRIIGGSHSGSVIENNIVRPAEGKALLVDNPAGLTVRNNSFYFAGGSVLKLFEWGGSSYDFAGWSTLANVSGNVWSEGGAAPPTRIAASPTPKPVLAGDANGSGTVDLADFTRWKSEYLGQLLTKTADFNHSGTVDLVDFAIWKQAYLAR